ncbi:uncharacterized protein [Venturia canescens]|uniref:uncharacterized protein n=1 Tax=Venturia canescens TaxID=32260 RepID=UPI001C9BD4B0|nr:uncharacterized protein LOC122413829 [Venturia canescens]
MSNKCMICKKPVSRSETLKCIGECNALFHILCASKKYQRELDELKSCDHFLCDSCDDFDVHDSSVVAVNDSESPPDTITLVDIMRQLSSCTASTNTQLSSMQRAITKVGENINALQMDVRQLTTSHEALVAKVTTLEENVIVNSRETQRLRDENVQLSKHIQFLERGMATLTSSKYPFELTITGCPPSLKDPPDFIVNKVFNALGVTEFLPDIISIRKLPEDQLTVGSGTSSSQRTSHSSHVSYIVYLKSTAARDTIIQRRRELSEFTVKEVLKIEQAGNIFVNEHIPPYLYKLLKQAKARAKSNDYKFVWARSGKVWVRKANGTEPVPIMADSDLDKIA